MAHVEHGVLVESIYSNENNVTDVKCSLITTYLECYSPVP